MNKRLVMLLIVGMFAVTFMPFISSLESLGTFEQNTCVTISQTCATCSYVNISSVSNKDNDTIISNIPMAFFGNGEWRYELCDTQYLDRYDVRGVGDIDGIPDNFATYFYITPSGKTSSSGESILYFGLIFIFFGLVCLLFYFIIVIPYYNERNENDAVIGINKLKYLKVTLIAILYPVVILLLNFLNGISQNFTTLSIFGGTIGFLFETMLRAAWVWTVLIMIWIIVLLIRDTNFKKLIKSGKYY